MAVKASQNRARDALVDPPPGGSGLESQRHGKQQRQPAGQRQRSAEPVARCSRRIFSIWSSATTGFGRSADKRRAAGYAGLSGAPVTPGTYSTGAAGGVHVCSPVAEQRVRPVAADCCRKYVSCTSDTLRWLAGGAATIYGEKLIVAVDACWPVPAERVSPPGWCGG